MTSLTYCFSERDWSITYDNGETTHGYRLPEQYRFAIDTAAQVWTERPGLRVSLVQAPCTSKVDIRVYGFHGRNKNRAGEGGCFGDSEQFCKKGTGFIFLSTDRPADERHQNAYIAYAVHEFGHVLGLEHPCGNVCEGPVMSKGSCPHVDQCPYYPIFDDVVGVQLIHGWTDSSGGCTAEQRRVHPLPIDAVPEVAVDPGQVALTLDGPPDLSGAVAPTLHVDPEASEDGALDPVRLLTTVGGVADLRFDAYGAAYSVGGAASREVAWAAGEAGVTSVPEVTPGYAKCLTGLG